MFDHGPSPGSATGLGRIGHNVGVAGRGKRAGARRAGTGQRAFDRTALVLCAAITVCVIAWGYLVYAAIDFGTSARDGASSGWAFMALAAVGAMACLFFGLMLGTRLLSRLGVIAPEEDPPSKASQPGGKRAAR